MSNRSKSFKLTPIPSRAKNGDPMTYLVLSDDGKTHTKVSRAVCLACSEEPDSEFPQRWFVDEESGLVVRLPRTSKGDEIARENMRSVWREAKRQERWAARTETPVLNDEGDEVFPEIVDTSVKADVASIVEEKALLETLYAALAILTEEEVNLIQDIFWQGKTERQIAENLGLSQKAVNKRKQKLLGRLAENEALKNFFE